MRVLLLEDDPDTRETLKMTIEILGKHDCLALGSYYDLLQRANEALQTNFSLLDINLGPAQPNGIDAMHWLRRKHYEGKIAFLTGHARSHPLVMQALEEQEIPVLQKPLKIDDMLALLSGEHRAA